MARNRNRRGGLKVTATATARPRRQSRSRSRSRVGRRGIAKPTPNNSLLPSRVAFNDIGGPGVVTRYSNSRARRSRGNPGSFTAPGCLGGYVDPFSEEAQGQRYPDDYAGLSGTFSTTLDFVIQTSPGVGVWTDANLAQVTPNLGTALFAITPDPSNVIVNGLLGTQGLAGGQWTSVPNIMHWPNGVLFKVTPGTLNAFGPGSGIINIDIPSSNIVAMRALFNQARLVTGGATFSSSMPFSVVSGTVHYCPVPVSMLDSAIVDVSVDPQTPVLGESKNGWQVQLPQTLADMANMPGYGTTPLASLENDEVVGLFSRYGPAAKLFKSIQNVWGCSDGGAGSAATRYGVDNATSDYGHHVLVVCITGVLQSSGTAAAANTPIGEMVVRGNYECTTKASSWTAFGSGAAARVFAGQSLVSPAPPHQPVLDAALDNVAAAVPSLRVVDKAGVEEGSFLGEVQRLWNSATQVASSVLPAVEMALGMFSALAL